MTTSERPDLKRTMVCPEERMSRKTPTGSRNRPKSEQLRRRGTGRHHSPLNLPPLRIGAWAKTGAQQPQSLGPLSWSGLLDGAPEGSLKGHAGRSPTNLVGSCWSPEPPRPNRRSSPRLRRLKPGRTNWSASHLCVRWPPRSSCTCSNGRRGGRAPVEGPPVGKRHRPGTARLVPQVPGGPLPHLPHAGITDSGAAYATWHPGTTDQGRVGAGQPSSRSYHAEPIPMGRYAHWNCHEGGRGPRLAS